MVAVLGVLMIIALRVLFYDMWMGAKRQQFVKELGPGINLGNSLDVDNLRQRKPEAALEEYETYWGNPVIKKELFQEIKEKGFKTVRLPVTWGEHMDENGRVDVRWMARVKEVTDWALDAGLYVILDTHHESWLVPAPEKEAQTTQRLCFLWQQISDTFAQTGDHLLFEGMNEPRLRGSEEEWTGGSLQTQQVVNRLNRAFVDTVRKSGGNNENRWLLVCPYASSHVEEALKQLKLPEDDRLIVAVHAYLPYGFTLDDNGKDSFDPYRSEAEDELGCLMENLQELFIREGTPVMITEFGCHEKPSEEERLKWLELYLEKAKEARIPCIWWDNGKDSQIIHRESLVWTREELAELLVSD